MSWISAGPIESLPPRGARVLRVGGVDIALFRTSDDRVFALRDRCPHRGGPLSQGIVHGERVTCPLHDWVIDLKSGSATGADEGCTPTFEVRIEDGEVFVNLPAKSVPAPDSLGESGAGTDLGDADLDDDRDEPGGGDRNPCLAPVSRRTAEHA